MRPRNEHPDRWTVGKRGSGGELTGGLGPGYIWVNAFNGVGITVRLDLNDAEEFGKWLILSARAFRLDEPQ